MQAHCNAVPCSARAVHGTALQCDAMPCGTARRGVVSAQSNAGISTGIVNPDMPLSVEIMLIINMWVGRLEIIPILSAIGFMLSMRHSRK